MMHFQSPQAMSRLGGHQHRPATAAVSATCGVAKAHAPATAYGTRSLGCAALTGIAPAPFVPAPAARAKSSPASVVARATAPEYSADMAAEEWSRRPVPVVARLLEIVSVFGGWWVRSVLHRDTQKAAAEMREVLVDLGPAFVKIGQALASRPDVLPPEYISELELLQDRIPPFSNDEALQVIEEELGLPWTQVFSVLSPCPVAAASLGQVYRGRLVSNGAEVAVKVQRPGVVEAIGRDTYILRGFAAIARQRAKLNTDLPALVDEWASSLFKELDYRREAANAIRFAELFSFMPEVMVPKMYTEWTTTRVLVMEWIEGERLRSASRQAPVAAVAGVTSGSSSSSGVGAEVAARQALLQHHHSSPDQAAEDLRLVDIGVRCSLEQMLEEGYFHADPHPGNLLKTLDGRLAYIDFGMMGSIEPPVRQALIRATLHLVNREFERLAEDFVELGLLPRGADMDEVIPALTGVFQTALAGGVSNISFSTLSADLGRTMYRYSFRLPPYYTLLVRSLSVLEGIALASDPNYKVLGAAYPWVSRRLLLTTNSPELTATLDNLLYDSQGRFNFDRLESLLQQAAKARVEANAATRAAADSSAVQISASSRAVTPAAGVDGTTGQQQGFLATVAAAVGGVLAGPEGSELLLSSLQLVSGSSGSNWQQQVSGRGSAAAAAGGPLALVLSPEGRHIRGILEDELAKGLDAAWRLNLDRTLDSASEQLEGALSYAASTPLGNTSVVQWLQQQAWAAGSNSSSAASDGADATTPALTSNTSINSSSSSSGGDGRPDLLESLLNLPRLAGEDDRVQVEGLQRLAVQLAAFSSPPATTSSSSSLAIQQHQQHQQQLTPQQEANAAALQQVRQAALVLRWFASEVQLLSPTAQREALAIPMRILSKLGSRLTARAVRAVLTPGLRSPTGLNTAAGTRSTTLVSSARSAAAAPVGAAAVVNSKGASIKLVPTIGTTSSSSTVASSNMDLEVKAASGPPGLPAGSNGRLQTPSASSNGSSSSSSPPSSRNGGSQVQQGGIKPLQAGGNSGARGGRMMVLSETALKEAAAAADGVRMSR